MDLSYTAEEEAFRARVRAWIAQNKPAAGRAPGIEDLRAWQLRLHQAGFLGAAWPKEHGGAGLSPMEQAILNEELARANAPGPLGSMGISWVGPAILRFGSEEQKRKFIPRLLAGEDIWATGYSEPGAGSDMYNTQTRAVREGDGYVINGQKIWTSLAHVSNWYFLLCRTSSEGHKVAGLTLFLVPMQSKGIEIRPTKMITGDTEFSEVFLRDVRVPKDAVLGREGQGYEVVSSALINERSGIATAIRFDQSLAKLIETARKAGVTEDPIWRQRIAQLAIQTKIMNASGLRVLSDQLHDRFNPHTSAAMKCIATLLTQRFSEAAVEMQGPWGVLLEGREDGDEERRTWPLRFLYDRAMTIAGGTSEIQRNIAAERILGLPRQ
ncbi:MAG: acyl-CoA dehydrogenase family protein [Candidatus Limnocylindria bacterium]